MQQRVKAFERESDMRVNWRGVFPAATTRFTEDGAIDLVATGHQLEGDEPERITALSRCAIKTRSTL
jgi:hypothetical protein